MSKNDEMLAIMALQSVHILPTRNYCFANVMPLAGVRALNGKFDSVQGWPLVLLAFTPEAMAMIQWDHAKIQMRMPEVDWYQHTELASVELSNAQDLQGNRFTTLAIAAGSHTETYCIPGQSLMNTGRFAENLAALKQTGFEGLTDIEVSGDESSGVNLGGKYTDTGSWW